MKYRSFKFAVEIVKCRGAIPIRYSRVACRRAYHVGLTSAPRNTVRTCLTSVDVAN